MSEPLWLAGQPYALSHPLADDGRQSTLAEPLSPVATRPLLVAMGDSFTVETGTAPTRWAALVAASTGLELLNLAHSGAGYVRVSGWTLALEASGMMPADPAVVVLWGGYNDRLIGLPPLELEYAARSTFASIRRIAPAAELVVLGPQWPATPPDATAVAYRDAVAAAATGFDLPFVDTLGWFAGRGDLIGPDGLHPTEAAQPYIADLVAPHVEAAIGRLEARGAMLAHDAP